MAQQENDAHDGPEVRGACPRQCALCGRDTIARGRDPLVRSLGLVLLYAAVLLLLIWLPAPGPGKVISAGIIGAWGCVLLKNPQRLWCTNCWFSKRRTLGTDSR